jgi:hypothetical protein
VCVCVCVWVVCVVGGWMEERWRKGMGESSVVWVGVTTST